MEVVNHKRLCDPLFIAIVSVMEGFVRKLKDTIVTSKDYQSAAQLLWLPSKRPSIETPYSEAIRKLLCTPPDNAGYMSTSSPIEVFIHEHILCMVALSQGNTSEAFNRCNAALQTLLKLLPADSKSELPVLKRVCLNFFHLASTQAEREEAARQLSRAFTVCITDRSQLVTSKRWAAINIANILFRIYFQLGTIRLGANIIRAIDASSGAPTMEQLPKADAVTFNYFRARLAINQGQFQAAEELLMKAVQWCSGPASSSSQKK